MAGLFDFLGLGGSPGILPQQGNGTAAIQNFAAAPTILGGLSNAYQGATTGQRTDPLGMQQQAQQATFNSLVGSGVHPAIAQAATLNPEILKTIAPAYFDTQPKLQETGVDPFTGQKSFSVYNAQRQTLTPVNGGPGQASQPQGGGSLGAFQDAANKGVTGDALYDYLPAGVRPTIRAMIEGKRAPPTGMGMRNPAVIAMVEAAHAIDPTFDENSWSARHKMQIDLASSTPNSIGGILSNGKSAFAHLGNLSDKFVNLGNYGAGDMPGSGMVAGAGNFLKNQLAPSGKTQENIQATADNLLKYGQEATKFYAGSGGGEMERMGALRALNPATATSNQAVGFLETEKQLMLERLNQKEAQIRDTLGESYLAQHPVRTKDLEATLKKIDDNIAKLRGDTGSAVPAPARGADGWTQIAPGIKIRPKQ